MRRLVPLIALVLVGTPTAGAQSPFVANVLPSWGRRLRDIGYETDLSDPQVVRVRYSIVSPDGGAPRVVTGSSAIGPIWWSAGDRYIAFDGRLDAETVNRDGTHRASVPDAISGPWAPHALRAAFAIEPLPNNRIHLYTVSPTGHARRQLTRGRESVRALDWTRNGRWILFARNTNAGVFDLYVIGVKGGSPRLLASGARAGRFSPSGMRVVYSRRDGGLTTVGIDGRHRRLLTGDGANPSWSPDGTWIVFQAGNHIDLIRSNGSQRHTLVGS